MAEGQETQQKLQKTSQQQMQKGTKSFSWAALFFDSRMRESVQLLYRWCRYCDDQMDEAKEREANARLTMLFQKTEAALKGESVAEEPFQALQLVFWRHEIPRYYAFELLEGMRMDVEKKSYRSLEELELYCFRVAGVVGLMMSHIMGVSHERALNHAVDLGIAMQMTNIARDVGEDFNLGRVYLPEQWLPQGLVRKNGEFSPERALPAVKRLLKAAEQRYRSGLAGIEYLPIRAAVAIAIAARIYRAIGESVERREERAWSSRVFVSWVGKLRCTVNGLVASMPMMVKRIFASWKPVRITEIWRWS